MKEVKEKQHMKVPKAQDPAKRMPRTTQKAYQRVNEQIPFQEEPYDSPSDYAEQKAEQYSQKTADRVYHGAKKTVQKAKDEVRDIHDRLQEHRKEQAGQEYEPVTDEHPRADASQTPSGSQEYAAPEYSQRPVPKTRDAELEYSVQGRESLNPDTSGAVEHYVPNAQRQREILEQRYGHIPESGSFEPVTVGEDGAVEIISETVPSHLEETAPTNRYEASVTSSGYVSGPREQLQTRYKQEGDYYHASQQTEGQIRSVQSTCRSVSTEQTAVQKPVVRERSAVSTVKQVPQGAVKGTEKTVKVADRTIKSAKTTVKTAEKTVKTAEKTAKAAEKAAKAAKETAVKAAQATAKAAQAAAKAIAAAVKAIIAAVKELIAAIAAGGWVAVLVILILALIALIVASCFGLFWSNDASEGQPMSAIIASIDRAYQSKIDKAAKRLEDKIDHDEFEIVYRGDNNDGDSVAVYNWNDVLAVYAVLYTSGNQSMVLIEPSDETERQLSEVFNVMNTVTLTYELHDEVPVDAPKPTADPDGNVPEPETVTVLTVNVHQYAMTYKEAASYYQFDGSQMQMLEEMMSPAYYSYYAALIGVDVYGGTDYTQIISHLPANSKGAEVVKAAMTRLGCPYVWGAKGSTKFDCSGLAYWSIKQVDPVLGDRMYTNAAGQAKYCYDRGLTVGRSELQPGDLVFWVNKKCEGCHRWKEIHHVGIYIGEGKVVEAASGKGRVLVRDLWESKNYPILMFGRPYQ